MKKHDFNFAGLDRRRSDRVSFWSMFSVREISTNELVSTSGYGGQNFVSSINISPSGMLFESYDKYDEGSILSLDFTDSSKSSQDSYNFIGKVVHCSKFKRSNSQGVGVKFLKKPSNLEDMII